jgi:integrase
VKLTDKAIASFQPPAGKTDHIEIDSGFPGFGVRFRGKQRSWIFQYAFGSGAKRVNARMTLGKWPALPAVKARSIAEDLHARVRLGGHPAADKKVSRAEAGHTFEKLIAGYLEFKKSELRPKTLVEITRHLNVYAAPLHGLPVSAINLRRVVELIDTVAKERGNVSANRTQTTLSSLFSWAMRKGLATANPLAAAQMRRERSRSRVLADHELAAVWNALGNTDFGDILKLLILCGARAAEIGALRWTEVSFDRKLISLPAERVKNNRPHTIPLSEPMLAILQRRAQSKLGDLVFSRSGNGFLGWGRCKAKLDCAITAELGKSLEPWVIHDLRRSFVTGLARLGVDLPVIEKIVNHASGSFAGIVGVYQHHSFEAEKHSALGLWGAHVVAIASGGTGSNITPLTRRA